MMNTTTIVAMLAILSGATLSITGLTVISSVDAQMTADNATMGNMSGGNMSGGNTTEAAGSISGMDEFPTDPEGNPYGNP
jgi:hypothetical protein